jgi:hypothetical protein
MREGGTLFHPPTPTPGTLSATVSRLFLVYTVNLKYGGASTSIVDIYRNGTKVASASNSGSYSERVPRGTYRYKVCNAGSTWCSTEIVVTV